MKGALCKVKLVEGKLSSFDGENENKSAVAKVSSDALADHGDLNANSTKEGGGPTRPLCQALSSGGHFAYCGLLTEALCLLFTEQPEDKAFANATLQKFIRHIDIQPTTQTVMEMTLNGTAAGCGWKNYVEILKEEPALTRNFVPLVQDLIMFAVQGGSYDARTRVLINLMGCQLHVSSDIVELIEETVLEFLAEGKIALSAEAEALEQKQTQNAKYKRYAMIGLATVGGGTLLGLTGGLAAPFIGAGLGTIIGAGGATAIASTAGVAVIGSLFGAAGAGLTGYKMKKRVGAVEEFCFEYLTEGHSLDITICISGWVSDDAPDAFQKPWLTLYNSKEQYCLRYESKYLLEMGRAMDLLLQFAVSVAVQESLKYTILAGIISAITWPTSLLTLASVIDNPWGVCLRRSAESGRQLASALVQRYHGRRPVTLIGYSLGARVIYYCLRELALKEDSAGIVQDAILLGAPVSGAPDDWKKMCPVVSGRIINGYCETDWLLRFLYRTSSASIRIAGLQKVNWTHRKMFNFNLSDIVKGHSDYSKELYGILKTLGIRTRLPPEGAGMRKSKSDMPQTKSLWLQKHTGLRRCKSDSQLLKHRILSSPVEKITKSRSSSFSSIK